MTRSLLGSAGESQLGHPDATPNPQGILLHFYPSALGEPGSLSMLGKHSVTQRHPSPPLPLGSVHSSGSSLLTYMLPVTGAADPSLCVSFLPDQSPIFPLHHRSEPCDIVGGGWRPWAIRPERRILPLCWTRLFVFMPAFFQRTSFILTASHAPLLRVYLPLGCQDWSPDTVLTRWQMSP